MNRRRLIEILTAVSGLYVVIWVGFVLWAAHENKRNNWLVDKEADPAVAPLPNVSEDDWIAILANPNFASKSQEERISIANRQFDKIKALAGQQGYDLKALQRWYQQTARDFERYPIQKFVFAQGMETYYRDLRQSEFPKPGIWRVFWDGFLSKDAMLAALIGLPFVAISVLLIVGIIIAVFSKRLAFQWRALVIALMAIVLGEAWFMRNAAKHPVSLGVYNFYDRGAYISVTGTWTTSDTKLAATEQATQLDCWRQWNHCIEATAQILNGQLLVSTDYWEIKNWQSDEITFDSHDRSPCVVESLRVDRRSKVVTATSVPKQPQPDSCRGFEKGPIVYHMVDGYKLQYK